MKILITGGTVFVSRYAASYFSADANNEVYVLNRNSRHQDIYPDTLSLEEGMKEAAKYYVNNQHEVNKKPFFEYIDEKLAK